MSALVNSSKSFTLEHPFLRKGLAAKLAPAFRATLAKTVEISFVQKTLQRTVFIGLAGLLGTLGRYALSGFVARRFGETFPTGTLVVNVVGCFLAGLLFYLMQERFLVSQTIRTVVMIGFLGGFTTFSSFSLQTFTLLRDGEFGLATLNVIASNIAGLLTVWVGYTLGKLL
jgi:CrcB protein